MINTQSSRILLMLFGARGSGDRAIDSGSIGRGFESLRAHASLSLACLGLNLRPITQNYFFAQNLLKTCSKVNIAVGQVRVQ